MTLLSIFVTPALAEPKFHVGEQLYTKICDEAEEVGLRKILEPQVGGSRAALFTASQEKQISG